jgi:hypothetical protein
LRNAREPGECPASGFHPGFSDEVDEVVGAERHALALRLAKSLEIDAADLIPLP